MQGNKVKLEIKFQIQIKIKVKCVNDKYMRITRSTRCDSAFSIKTYNKRSINSKFR